MSHFGNYIEFSEIFITGEIMKTARRDESVMTNDVLVKFVQVAVESCVVLQNQLTGERNPACAQELISVMAKTMIVIRAIILQLLKRSDGQADQPQNEEYDKGYEEYVEELLMKNDHSSINQGQSGSKSKANHGIAWILWNELLNRCPTISAPFLDFKSPVITIVYDILYKPFITAMICRRCTGYHKQFLQMIVASQCDLNSTDNQGNSILHNIICDFLQEIDFHSRRNKNNALIVTALQVVGYLLENGAYPHTRNRQGNCPVEGLTKVKLYGFFNPETLIGPLRKLLSHHNTNEG